VRRILGREMDVEVLGLRLTVKTIILLAVLACLLVLVGLMITDLVHESDSGPPYNLTERNETTGLYETGDQSPALCLVFIFLALVLIYFIVVEIRS
jgi:hypothetical protein